MLRDFRKNGYYGIHPRELGLAAGVLGLALFVCVVLAIAVRIGNAIIGF